MTVRRCSQVEKADLAAKAADLAEEVKEGLLGHVFGFGDVAQHAKAKGIDAAFVQRVELGEGFGVSGLCALDRFGFAGDRGISFEQAGTGFRFQSFVGLVAP